MNDPSSFYLRAKALIMKRILANDGIHSDGKSKLEAHGFELVTERIENEDLPAQLPAYDAILVRSATKVRASLIDQCPNLKLIGRGGVGMDNIDVDYAESKGIKVINTPAASSRSVAELALGHMISLARGLHLSNREMPERGVEEFKKLKKSYSNGFELQGKSIGIIGYGRIGQKLGELALAMGMNVMPVGRTKKSYDIKLSFPFLESFISTSIQGYTMDEMLPKVDFISIHVPSQDEPLIGKSEIDQMKASVILVNTSRGGIIDEQALIEALDSGRIHGAALDVFENEPKPKEQLVCHPGISCSPHIGGSTSEAQRNIGLELADQIIEFFGSSEA